MVTLNFTLVVELVLFLIFLWGTNVWIIRPTLRVLDERDQFISETETRAQAQRQVAMADEARYAGELAKVRRQAEDRLHQARRKAQDEHTATLIARRKDADAAVAAARAEARQKFKAERDRLGELAPDVAAAIAARLGLEEYRT